MTEIRPATNNDAPGLVAVLGWLPEQSRILMRSPDGDLRVNEARLVDPRWCTLVAIDPESGRVLGAAVGYDSRGFENTPIATHGRPSAMLEDLVVDSDHERRGIGRSLVFAFERWAVSRGCDRVELSGGPNPVFYERCGYAKQGSFFHFVKEL